MYKNKRTGKIYTLEDLKDFWRNINFVCYNDKDFFEWLENQTIFEKVDKLTKSC